VHRTVGPGDAEGLGDEQLDGDRGADRDDGTQSAAQPVQARVGGDEPVPGVAQLDGEAGAPPAERVEVSGNW
jgi:hypothetical protein